MKKETVVNPVVKQLEDQPVDVEILATSIVKVSEAADKLLKSGLHLETITVLLSDLTNIGKPAIRIILRALPELRKRYTTR
jgi:hypothetical protein